MTGNRNRSKQPAPLTHLSLSLPYAELASCHLHLTGLMRQAHTCANYLNRCARYSHWLYTTPFFFSFFSTTPYVSLFLYNLLSFSLFLYSSLLFFFFFYSLPFLFIFLPNSLLFSFFALYNSLLFFFFSPQLAGNYIPVTFSQQDDNSLISSHSLTDTGARITVGVRRNWW